MSDRDGNSSGSQGVDKGKCSTSTEEMTTQPRANNLLAGEPIQFRVRSTNNAGASAVKLVTMEDILKATHGMENMALAHEIAIDNSFRLEPYEPPENSYQKLIKETMHKAYFDILREQLNEDPPNYTKALVLLKDVKEGLLSLPLPHQVRLRKMLDDCLDIDLIKQQAENNSLDFHETAKFIIDLMAKLAAPARDEIIEELAKLTDTVDIFRRILEILEIMKMDIANMLITMVRPQIQKESILYERMKFDEMLNVTEDGLRYTKEWLVRNLDKTGLTLPVTAENVIRHVVTETLAKSYLELLEWNSDNTYPESMALDAHRFADLGIQIYRITAVASLMLASPSASANDPDTSAQHKEELKEKIFIIMDNASNDTELNAVLPSIAEEVILMTDQLLKKLQQQPLNANTKSLIRTQIISLEDPKHRVRLIVRQRIFEFLKTVLLCSGGPTSIPIGLSAFGKDLNKTSATLLRYVTHNKSVFINHYMDIITEELSKNNSDHV